MEVVLTNIMISSGETTWVDTYIGGKTRPWMSLELVSIEGQIHFYIWAKDIYKNLIEAQLYAQYPGIEVIEVPDYSINVPEFDPATMGMFGIEYGLDKDDPYPIKTYVDFGLDKDPKEEYKVDPLASVLEFLSTMGPGEQFWIQIGLRAHKKKHLHGTYFGTTDLVAEGHHVLDELRESLIVEREDGSKIERFPTKGESDTMAAIERSISKYAYDTLIRSIYVARKENFKAAPRIHPQLGLFKSFGSKDLNSIVPNWVTGFNYEQFGIRDKGLVSRKRFILAEYQSRSFFYSPPSILRHIPLLSAFAPHHAHPFILNVEELATIYHLPGSTAAAPGLDRILSRKGEAPRNLPQ
jgi:hypothetical protein